MKTNAHDFEATDECYLQAECYNSICNVYTVYEFV